MTSLACLSTRRTLLALTALAAVACSFPDRTFDDNQFYSTQGGSGGASGSSQGGRSGSSQGGAGTSPEGGGSDEVGGDAGSEQGGEAGTEAGGEAGTEQGGEAGTEQGGEAGTSAGDGGTTSGNAGKGGAAGTSAGTGGVSGSSGQGGAGQSGSAGTSAGTAGTSAGTAGKGGTAGTSGGSGQGGTSAGTGGTGPITCTSGADCPSPQLCNDIDFDKGTAKCNTGQATGAEIGQTCASNGDCKSLFCDISNTCAIFCASDAECGAGNVCASTPYFPTADANECLRSCKRNADCPANTGKLGGLCMALPNADKKSIAGACNYLGSDPPGSNGHSKTFGQAVVQGVDGCDTGLVYPVNSTPTCTRLCITNADCASPMPKCQQLQVQNSQLGITSTISACIP